MNLRCLQLQSPNGLTSPTKPDDASSSGTVARADVVPIAAGSDLAAQDHAGLLRRADELDAGILERLLKLNERVRATGRYAIVLLEPLDREPVGAGSLGQVRS